MFVFPLHFLVCLMLQVSFVLKIYILSLNYKVNMYEIWDEKFKLIKTVKLICKAHELNKIYITFKQQRHMHMYVQYKVIKWKLYVTPKKFPDKGVFPFENGIKKWLFPYYLSFRAQKRTATRIAI